MRNKHFAFVVAFLLVLSIALVADSQKYGDIRLIENGQITEPSLSSAVCNFTKTDGIANIVWGVTMAGTGLFAYYDASVCGTGSYPFQITEFSFTLDDIPGQTVWPAYVDIVVHEMATPGDPCGGPGAEICRQSVIADQATFAYPNVGTVTLYEICCVDGPFFMGLEVTQGEINTTPGLMWDGQIIPDCEGWALWMGVWDDYTAWSDPPPPLKYGYPLYWIGGNPNSIVCGGDQCYWQPGDHHKMHYPQLPNETGWDVATNEGMETADDWECSETGNITDIHFWAGWKNDVPGTVDSFLIRIYEDIPANPPANPFSHPGELLWELYVPKEEIDVETFSPGTYEGWWNPVNGARISNSAQTYYQYNICLPSTQYFHQDIGTIYWLSITPYLAPNVEGYEWGWKSTADHFNDNAVYNPGEAGDWIPIWEPDEVLGNGFLIIMDENGDTVETFHENAFGEGWYFYPQSDWWNAWFYDHPFDPRRMKRFELLIEDVIPYTPGQAFLEIAINWSTAQWSLDQPPADSSPPLPGVDESLYIERSIVYQGDPAVTPGGGVYLDSILSYNPEWVSIDVRGYNFLMLGQLIHECRGPMDLAFVITGVPDPTQRCCFPDGDCQMLTLEDCVSLGGTTYGGECGTPQACCLPDTTCAMLDSVCCVNLGGTPLGEGVQCSQYTRACCFPDGSCEGYMDSLCCLELGGTPSEFVNCGGDLNQNGIDDNCEPEWTACCLPDGTCEMIPLDDCANQGGTSFGWRFVCWGDNNADGIDDRCEEPWQPGDDHKMHFPQLPDVDGWAVLAQNVMIADDWECTDSGTVNNIHFWGAYQGGINVEVGVFELRIFEDIPADQSPTGYSMPGALLWEYFAMFPNYTETIIPTPPQGWYDPESQTVFPDDHQEMIQYDVYIPDSLAFVQDSGTVYWLGIRAETGMPPPMGWGWKSSEDHWNDDAVWGFFLPPSWTELYEPTAFTVSMDMAFVITGKEAQAEPCKPGDANGDNTWNIGDATYVINFVFKGGPEPLPWPLCSGDANCDCTINIADAVYCINYIFKGGPPPCTEAQWILNCGPLRE